MFCFCFCSEGVGCASAVASYEGDKLDDCGAVYGSVLKTKSQ